jgi:hypothetical protein
LQKHFQPLEAGKARPSLNRAAAPNPSRRRTIATLDSPMDLIAHDGKSRMLRGAALALACALALSACKGKRRNVCPAAESGPWKFGVMADSQWTAGDDGKNPHSVAAGIISQLNQEFIAHGVRLVVAVGDLADNACTAIPCPQMQTRAAFAQALYNARVGSR